MGSRLRDLLMGIVSHILALAVHPLPYDLVSALAHDLLLHQIALELILLL